MVRKGGGGNGGKGRDKGREGRGGERGQERKVSARKESDWSRISLSLSKVVIRRGRGREGKGKGRGGDRNEGIGKKNQRRKLPESDWSRISLSLSFLLLFFSLSLGWRFGQEGSSMMMNEETKINKKKQKQTKKMYIKIRT